MRATLIGRFLLIAIVCLMALLPLWYWASPWLAKPPIWLAGHAMKALFPWADGFEQHGVVATLLTKVQVRMQRGGADVLAELTPEASYPSYGYGLVLLWAMLIASHPHRWWLKGLIGTVILFPVQAWGLCFQWLRDVVLLSGPNGAAYLKYPQWAIDGVAYGYQFGFLMLTPVAPIILWLVFDKRFVAALWLEAALEGKPEATRGGATPTREG
ncbi:exosortase H-associated membrane protein [Ottowia sp.]|uniref:exosortase H-associated membrane protein n=1 Tax=Ottowia sp. TaxID=1898956 RepID=UPI002617672B|nr:exosortase H-associated membrane protein [Ottowia sp.]